MSQSNRYAKQVLEVEAYSQWDAITVEELKAFIGFCLLMGVSRLPTIYDYWKRDPFLRYSPIADRISRKRFRDLFRFLHFADNETLVPRGVDGHDRLGKVRPLIDYLSGRFADVYHPHCEVAVDEAMIKFQGRSSLKQYMPMKPVKRGIKVCMHNHNYHIIYMYHFIRCGCWLTVGTGTSRSLRFTPGRRRALRRVLAAGLSKNSPMA